MKRSEIADEYATGPMAERNPHVMYGRGYKPGLVVFDEFKTTDPDYPTSPYVQRGFYPVVIFLVLFWCLVTWKACS